MTVAQVADWLLDRTIAPGYSRIGYAVRKNFWPADPSNDALRGKVALVTGANSGLGKATARGLAQLGAQVHMLVRDLDRGRPAAEEVRAAVPGATIHLERCDVSSLVSVREFAAGFTVPLDVLVHNAGVLLEQRTETSEGNETTIATGVLGPFLLTRLLPLTGGGRVIWVSSGGMYSTPLTVTDPQFHDGYSGVKAYARTKRMQVTLAELWADELRDENVVVHSMHPGWADTPGVSTSLPRFHQLTKPFLRTETQGADTIVWLAAADEPGRSTGRFWHDRRPRPTHYLPGTRDDDASRRALWAFCQERVG